MKPVFLPYYGENDYLLTHISLNDELVVFNANLAVQEVKHRSNLGNFEYIDVQNEIDHPRFLWKFHYRK